jgi:hypothetical protein
MFNKNNVGLHEVIFPIKCYIDDCLKMRSVNKCKLINCSNFRKIAIKRFFSNHNQLTNRPNSILPVVFRGCSTWQLTLNVNYTGRCLYCATELGRCEQTFQRCLLPPTSRQFINIYQTAWRSFPKGSRLHTRRRENLKSHINCNCLRTRGNVLT